MISNSEIFDRAIGICGQEHAEEIRRGSPVVLAVYSHPAVGSYRSVLLWAVLAVEVDGTHAYAAEPVTQVITLKRGQTGAKMARWWGRKHFGTKHPVRVYQDQVKPGREK